MTSLPALLGAVNASLQGHTLCRRIASLEVKEFAPDQFHFKLRADLTGKTSLQVRIYYNHGHIDYAYQLFADIPLLRWDNKEEFRSLATYPHHHHDASGDIHVSPLIGEPIADIKIVMEAVSQFLAGPGSKYA